MGIMVFTFYLLALAIFVWIDVVRTWSGALVVGLVALVFTAALSAAAKMTRG